MSAENYSSERLSSLSRPQVLIKTAFPACVRAPCLAGEQGGLAGLSFHPALSSFSLLSSTSNYLFLQELIYWGQDEGAWGEGESEGRGQPEF